MDNKSYPLWIIDYCLLLSGSLKIVSSTAKISSNEKKTHPGDERHLTKDKPFRLRCPNCTNVVETRIEYTIKKKEAIPLCFLLLPLTLCWVPFIMLKFKTAIHFCSYCGAYIGIVD